MAAVQPRNTKPTRIFYGKAIPTGDHRRDPKKAKRETVSELKLTK